MNKQENEWIYYLKLEKKLGKDFIKLDSQLKKRGVSLIPIEMEQLNKVSRLDEQQVHLVCLVNSLKRASYFKRKVQPLLKFLLKDSSFNFYLASSFECFDDRVLFAKRKNYHITFLPVSFEDLAYSVYKRLSQKLHKTLEWPGAKRRTSLRGENI